MKKKTKFFLNWVKLIPISSLKLYTILSVLFNMHNDINIIAL